MGKKYVVELSEKERVDLQAIVRKGRVDALKRRHAQILLAADQGAGGPGLSDEEIVRACSVGICTVQRVRQRLVEEGLEQALARRRTPRPARKKLDGEGEARLVAVACSAPPQGQARWTLGLLAEAMVELKVVESIGRECVRQALKKTRSSLG